MPPRPTKEWIGKRPESMPPPRVRQRVFDAHNGTCHLCGLPIKAPMESWDLDHRTALINGRENVESNLAPAHKHCHLAKTAADVAEKSKVAKVRQKHTGARRPKQTLRSRNDLSTGKAGNPKPSLPPKRLFAALSGRGELYQAIGGEDHD